MYVEQNTDTDMDGLISSDEFCAMIKNLVMKIPSFKPLLSIFMV